MIDYHIDVSRRIVTTRISGPLAFAEVANHLHRLMRDPKFKADFNALIVAGDPAAVPSPTTVSALSPLVRAWSKRRTGAKWAFVLPDNATRTFADSVLNELKLTSVITRCFLSESAALAWFEPALAPAPPPAAARPPPAGVGDSGARTRPV